MNRIAFIAAAIIVAGQAAAADVAGDWQIEGTIGQMPVQVVCTLSQSDRKLTGACRNQEVGELPLSGETQGDTATWTYRVNYQGQEFTVAYNGTLESASAMKGSISVDGAPQGSFTGQKQ